MRARARARARSRIFDVRTNSEKVNSVADISDISEKLSWQLTVITFFHIELDISIIYL